MGGYISENKCRNLLVYKDLGRYDQLYSYNRRNQAWNLSFFFDVSRLIARVYDDRRARRRKSLRDNGLRRMAYPTE